MNNEELKPCAHCGAVPLIQEHEPHTHSGPLKAMGIPDHPGSFTIECPTDGCAAMIADTRQEVVATWNRRATAAQPASAPVASSIDTSEWLELLHQHVKAEHQCESHDRTEKDMQYADATLCALIAHIDAWGQQQHQAGLMHAIQTIKNSNDVAQEALRQRDALQKRAEAAEAVLRGEDHA